MSATPYCLTDKPESSAGSLYARVWKWGSWSHSGIFWNVGTMVNPSVISDSHSMLVHKHPPNPQRCHSIITAHSSDSFLQTNSTVSITVSQAQLSKQFFSMHGPRNQGHLSLVHLTHSRDIETRIPVSKEGNQRAYKFTDPQNLKPS